MKTRIINIVITTVASAVVLFSGCGKSAEEQVRDELKKNGELAREEMKKNAEAARKEMEKTSEQMRRNLGK